MNRRRAATGPDRQVPLLILGLGSVGMALLRQILATRRGLAQRRGLKLLPVGLADSQAFLYTPEGLSEGELQAALELKEAGESLAHFTSCHPLVDLATVLLPGSILVDLTASPGTSPLLRTALKNGVGLVLANKRPISTSWSDAHSFFDTTGLRYEATVGAGLPVIATLHTLLGAGDRVTLIEGCLSGTLGFLCTQLDGGLSYSSAVSNARDLGYTEPDPRDDLSGQDVARKALIMARTVGWPLEMGDLTVEPLYTEALSTLSLKEFLAAMPTLDLAYGRRVQDARNDRQVLRYRARVQADGGEVGLVAVPQESPLGALKGPANYIAIYSALYADHPLIISGPGAGPEVTAAGVLGDIIDLALSHDSLVVHLNG